MPSSTPRSAVGCVSRPRAATPTLRVDSCVLGIREMDAKLGFGLPRHDHCLCQGPHRCRIFARKRDSGEPVGVTGHRHGHRSRSLLGTFGRLEIELPRARLNTADGKTTEWKSQALRAYQRRTLAADALIASCYLAGTNTRRVRRALSRVWRKVTPLSR